MSPKKLKNKYLSKYIETVSAAEGALSLVTIKVDNLFLETKALLHLSLDEMAQFYDVVHDREFKEISEKYSNSRIIMYKIASGITDSDNCRKQVLKGMKLLKDSPLESFVNNAVDCHLRTSALSRKNKKKCELCSIHDDIEVYEKSIFHFVKGDLKTKQLNRSGLSSEDNKKLEEAGVYLLENQRIGNWTESETERLIRAVLKYLRTNKPLVSMSNEEGSTHLSLIEATKKEFKLIRILWRQVHDMVAAMDELNMCVMRLRLKYDDEPDLSSSAFKGKQSSSHPSADLSTREKDKFETIYIIEKHEIPSQKLKLVSEKTIAINEFRKKYGQLLYLENLKKTDFKENGGENPDPCPICQKELGRQWSVLQCGHSYCVECIRTLIDEYSSVNRRSLQCPMCRSMTFHSEISYVNTVKEESSEFNNIDEKALEDIKGSLSTKIESIVKTLFVIQKNDPDAKTLIFSSWADLLNIIAVALLENNIAYASLYSQGKFKRNLLKFKNRKDVKVLLLPISSGANGLNLIEASHVFLVEPILNPAQELQAIGRVHRIGQTKPTVVHRFLIRSTVEERMHKILSSYQRDEAKQGSHSTEENLITIKDLKNIFNDDCDDVN
ncbi:SHPRH [Lepeophtheirus salmonis]|uniref:SHPRH n=1 Tax=Lepeophtheirus salmonis TaxID=72036 RepID=A0A7R8CCF7_LEPSM|nr:SHPRH [Lepeophtheirus salmonis]CAF2765401.1 SHPRH [Lepeophtheirus salmonis]